MDTRDNGALSLAVDALAVHRMTRLLVEDEISSRLRDYLSENYPPHEVHGAKSFVTPSYVAFCPYCASVWMGLAVTLTHTRPLRFLRPVIYALALSGMTSLVADYAKKPGGWS